MESFRIFSFSAYLLVRADPGTKSGRIAELCSVNLKYRPVHYHVFVSKWWIQTTESVKTVQMTLDSSFLFSADCWMCDHPLCMTTSRNILRKQFEAYRVSCIRNVLWLQISHEVENNTLLKSSNVGCCKIVGLSLSRKPARYNTLFFFVQKSKGLAARSWIWYGELMAKKHVNRASEYRVVPFVTNKFGN